MSDLPDTRPKNQADGEPEELKRYRMRQEVKRNKATKALKEQMWIGGVSITVIGGWWLIGHLEIIEKEIMENPHWVFGNMLSYT